MRKYWGKFKYNTKILKEYIAQTECKDLYESALFAIQEICGKADISKPVVLSKHIKELMNFSRTVFYAYDFFNESDFDEFELEIISSDKK